MTLHLGNVPANSTLYIPFTSYDSNGASVTLTGLAVTDIEIYKNGSVTQRASDSGYALLDTDGIDFDGVTGLHGFSIDLSDNTDSGFYSVGGFFWVVVSTVTIDSQTVTLVPATFRIVAAENVTGLPVADATALSGDTTAADNAESFFDGTGYAGTNNVIPTVTSVTAIATGGITAASIATDAIDADALAADAIAEINATVDTALADYDAPTRAELTSDIGTVTSAISGLNDISVADILTTALADAYAANGAAPTLQQAIMGVHQYLMEKAITGTSYTVKKLDGTDAFVVTLDDATSPTASSRD